MNNHYLGSVEIFQLIFRQSLYQLDKRLADVIGAGGFSLVDFKIVGRNFDGHWAGNLRDGIL